MRKTQPRTIAAIAGLLFALTAGAAQQTSERANRIEPLPRDLEIPLALSSLPRHLRENGTYLTPPGTKFRRQTPASDEMRNFVEHGRWLHSPDPFVIAQGPHGFLIQHLGVTERDAINNEYAEMLARLCEIKEVWCLPKEEELRCPSMKETS